MTNRVRSAPIAYRSDGGIRFEYAAAYGEGTFWLTYVDAFLLFQDLKTALKGIDIKEKQ